MILKGTNGKIPTNVSCKPNAIALSVNRTHLMIIIMWGTIVVARRPDDNTKLTWAMAHETAQMFELQLPSVACVNISSWTLLPHVQFW